MSKTKKIIFLIPAMRGGGAERVISVLSDYFVKKNYQVKIVLFKDAIVEYQINPDVILDTDLIGKCGNPIKRILAFHNFLKKEGNAVVFSFFTTIGLYILLSAIGTKAKIIISERLDPAQSLPQNKILFMVRELLYKRASGFVFQTNDAMNFFDEKIGEKSVVIPNPIKDDLEDRYVGKRSHRVVTFARLESQKNYPLLINAFKIFSEKYPSYSLEIYGQGKIEAELRDLAYSLGLKERVIFKGFVRNVHQQVKDARMFVLPSDYEGLSNSMLEAMAIGLPVICTDCPPGGARMFIQNGVNGLLVPIKDKNAMVNAMGRIAESESLTEKLSINAEKIRELVNKESVCRMWENYIQKFFESDVKII